MNALCIDLNLMVLERLGVEQLRVAARVSKTLREYITYNANRMRRILCHSLKLSFADKDELLVLKVFMGAGDKEYKEYHSITAMYKYEPVKSIELSMKHMKNKTRRTEVEKMIPTISTWWIRKLGKIECCIDDFTFCAFTSQIPQMSKLRSLVEEERIVDSIEGAKKMIQCSQQMDQFEFPIKDTFDGSVLKEILDKSFMFPTQVPSFTYERITINQFIDFLERAKLSKIDCHHIIICLVGKLIDLQDWIQKNTDTSKITDKTHIVSTHRYKFIFSYRQLNFVVNARLRPNGPKF